MFENLLPQSLCHELGVLGQVNGFPQRRWQRVVPHGAAFSGCHCRQIFGHRWHQLILVFDAFQPGRKNHRIRQVRVRGRVKAAVFNAGRLHLVWFIQRNPHQRRPVIVPPRNVAGCFPAAPQALIRVNELVGDRREFGGMLEYTGNKMPPRF